MAKKSSSSGEAQFSITQYNLDKRGKTNKKLKRNSQASKYLTPKGKELKEQAEAFAKEHFKKGRRTAARLKRVEEERVKTEQLKAEQNAKRDYKRSNNKKHSFNKNRQNQNN